MCRNLFFRGHIKRDQDEKRKIENDEKSDLCCLKERENNSMEEKTRKKKES